MASPSFETEMNRHHFSLFIRNCRLILLLRREFGDGDLKSFRPAEFRWKLPQVTLNLSFAPFVCILPDNLQLTNLIRN